MSCAFPLVFPPLLVRHFTVPLVLSISVYFQTWNGERSICNVEVGSILLVWTQF